MGSLCTLQPSPSRRSGGGGGVGLGRAPRSHQGAKDLPGVAGKEVEPRDPCSLKNQDKGSKNLESSLCILSRVKTRWAKGITP